VFVRPVSKPADKQNNIYNKSIELTRGFDTPSLSFGLLNQQYIINK
jgi:hypothetical protein